MCKRVPVTVAVGLVVLGLAGSDSVGADEPSGPQSGGATAGSIESRLPPQKWALLIGVNDYTHFADLEFCDADVEGLKQRLVDADFPEEHVTVLRDGTARKHLLPFKNNVQRQLQLLLATVRPQDLVVVAFSGHGLHIDGTSYLCPIDSHFSDPQNTMVSLDSVYQMLEQCPARQKLLLVDACRNDPTPAGTKSPTTTKSAERFALSLNEQPPEGILLLTSCKAGQRSVEDPGFGHGVFMHFLMKALEGEADFDDDGKISVLELYMYAELKTKTHVRQAANVVQTPTLKGEFAGAYDVATVPKRTSPTAEAKPEPPGALSQKPAQPQPRPPAVAETRSSPIPPSQPTVARSGFKAAVAQADEYFLREKLDEAIDAYSTLILIEGTSSELHLKRGSVYLAKGDIEKAVIDYQLGGEPLPLTVVAGKADLRKGSDVTATVKQGQTLSITRVTRFKDRDWLWVAAVDGNVAARGWIAEDDVIRTAKESPVTSPRKTTTLGTATRSTEIQGTWNTGRGYNDGQPYRDDGRKYHDNWQGKQRPSWLQPPMGMPRPPGMMGRPLRGGSRRGGR